MDARSLVGLASLCFLTLALPLRAHATPAHIDAGPFTEIAAGLPDLEEGSAAWGDYDNDGDLDLAICGISASGPITRIYRNAGGVLTDIGAGLTGVYDGALAWGDYDNDGDLDLVVVGNTGPGPASIIYRNTG